METVCETKESSPKSPRAFDQMDKMPNISLKQLFYALKVSRKGLKQTYESGNVEPKLNGI